MEWHNYNEGNGLLRYPSTPSPLLNLPPSPILEGSSNSQILVTSTGNSMFYSPDPSDLISLDPFLETIMPRQLFPERIVSSTCGKKRRKLKAPNLNLDCVLLDGILLKIGRVFGNLRPPGPWTKYVNPYWCLITTTSKELKPITSALLEFAEMWLFIGDELVVENLEKHGRKAAYLLTLKIHGPNSGMVINLNQMLSSMNFAGLSTSPICYDGLIVTQSLWRSNAAQRSW